MENRTHDEILLEWRMSERDEDRYAMHHYLWVASLLVVGVWYIFYAVSHHWRFAVFYPYVVVYPIASVFVWPNICVSSLLRCTGQGVRVRPIFGVSHEVPWRRVKYLKRTRLGHTVLKFRGLFGSTTYLRLPDDVRRNLITILREHSNARIIGLD